MISGPSHDGGDPFLTALAHLLDHPGETSEHTITCLSALSDHATNNPTQRTQARAALVQQLQARDAMFPQRGVVHRGADGGWYVKIHDGGHYITTVSLILDALERAFDPPGFDPLRFAPQATSGGSTESQVRIYPPPSPWGTHISLGKAVAADRDGDVVAFTLDSLVHYAHDKRGKAPSGLDPGLFPSRWYVLYVKIQDFHVLAPGYGDHPHIAVGILGARTG